MVDAPRARGRPARRRRPRRRSFGHAPCGPRSILTTLQSSPTSRPVAGPGTHPAGAMPPGRPGRRRRTRSHGRRAGGSGRPGGSVASAREPSMAGSGRFGPAGPGYSSTASAPQDRWLAADGARPGTRWPRPMTRPGSGRDSVAAKVIPFHCQWHSPEGTPLARSDFRGVPVELKREHLTQSPDQPADAVGPRAPAPPDRPWWKISSKLFEKDGPP
jgi:hypothetical protein